MKLPHFLFLVIIASAVFSCATNKNTRTYITDYQDTSKKDIVQYIEPKIQKADLLSIFVYSEATIEGIDELYNLPNLGGIATGGQAQGFLVDNNGYIEYPRLGFIRAEGLTKQELADTIKARFMEKQVLVGPTVMVRLLNFKIIVMGEVSRPGPISVPGERVNILEAIGLAGDITLYGKKDEVIVIRETDGVREFGKIDLSSRSLFESPYYQLRQNDIVLVNPNRNKARIEEQIFAQRLSLGLTVISSIALLYNIFR